MPESELLPYLLVSNFKCHHKPLEVLLSFLEGSTLTMKSPAGKGYAHLNNTKQIFTLYLSTFW